MQDMPASTEHDPTGRIVVLEDTNDDGKMDKRTVFADGLVLPRALKVLDRGVLIAEPPNLWLARDTNGDLQSGHQGRRDEHLRPARRQRRAQRQRPVLGARQLDVHVRARRLPAAEGRQVRGAEDAVARPVGRDAWTTPAASIATRTRRRCSSTWCRRFHFCSNPNLLRTRGSYESIADQQANAVYPMRPDPRRQSRISGRRAARRWHAGGVHGGSGADGVSRRPAAADLYGNVFIAEPSGNLVGRLVIKRHRHGSQSRAGVRAAASSSRRPTSDFGR